MDDTRQLTDPLLIPPSGGNKSNSTRGLVFLSPVGGDPALAVEGVYKVKLNMPVDLGTGRLILKQRYMFEFPHIK